MPVDHPVDVSFRPGCLCIFSIDIMLGGKSGKLGVLLFCVE
jgi:hypothetical protein